MRILIVSDAWHPQINGVVRTLTCTIAELEKQGHQVTLLAPEAKNWRHIAAPSYPSIRLEFFGGKRIQRIIETIQPDCIHIATEGPLGWAARNMCMRLGKPFTTSYHTRFPEYLTARMPGFLRAPVHTIAYAVLRRFHAPSSAIMVSTASIERYLQKRKFRRLVRWSRGVDTNLFQPYGKNLSAYAALPRPISLYVGRVAVEKNLQAFLAAPTPGSKVVIGEGPDLHSLRQQFPATHFLGAMQGEILARHYAAADLFVFPSTTDTFGLVLLEAAAAGLRIASVPSPGPADIFADPAAAAFAVLDHDLTRAIHAALALPDNPAVPRRFAANFSWEACTRQFAHHLQAATPQAVKRITRLQHWLSRGWQGALAFKLK